ncbi:hypothetical protein D1872_257920 [compost metagenome]
MQDAKRIAASFLRGILRDQRYCSRTESREHTIYQTQQEELQRTAHHAHQRDRQRHAKAGAQQHRLASIAVSQSSPEGTKDKGTEQIRTVDRARPEHHF